MLIVLIRVSERQPWIVNSNLLYTKSFINKFSREEKSSILPAAMIGFDL